MPTAPSVPSSPAGPSGPTGSSDPSGPTGPAASAPSAAPPAPAAAPALTDVDAYTAGLIDFVTASPSSYHAAAEAARLLAAVGFRRVEESEIGRAHV